MIPESVFYREVRAFAVKTKVFETAIRYSTKPDEAWDLTLVSQRVYGNRYEALTIMAAAGLDRVDQELKQQSLVLPTPSQLISIKKKCGYVGPGDVE